MALLLSFFKSASKKNRPSFFWRLFEEEDVLLSLPVVGVVVGTILHSIDPIFRLAHRIKPLLLLSPSPSSILLLYLAFFTIRS